MKRFISMIICAVFLVTTMFPYITCDICVVSAATSPIITGEAAVLIDADTGQVLYEKNMKSLLEPASTTKIMTCILALENLKLEDKVTIDADTPFTTGSRIYLEQGEEITVKDLIYALMLESANDAAVALANAVSGDVETFAALMNKKAKEVGAETANFKNPNGLHDEGHLVSPYDLAMIAKYCMKNEQFRKIVSTYRYEMSATNKRPERTETPMYNSNRLLYDESTKIVVNGVTRAAKYDGVTGIKTGYTNEALGCFVAGAERDGTELIAVVMRTTDLGRFEDCATLLDYGFENYHTVTAVEKGADLGFATVKRGAKKQVGVTINEDIKVTLPASALSSVLTNEIILDEKIKAPIKIGDKVGIIKIYEGGNLIKEVNVVATEDIKEGTLLSIIGIGNTAAYVIYSVLGAVTILFVAFTILKIRIKKKRAKRRKQLREQRAMEIARQRMEHKRDCDKRDWYF